MAKLKMRVRFDYVGRGKSSRFFGGKSSEEQAEELRQHKVSLIRNVPLQGISIEEIDMSQEIYSLYDEITGKSVSYAPVIICFTAVSMEDAIKFTMKEEFRTIDVLEPEEMVVANIEIERLLSKINEELLEYRDYLERKIENWR